MTDDFSLHFIVQNEPSVVVAVPRNEVMYRSDIWVHFANTDAAKGELQLVTDRRHFRRRVQEYEGEVLERHYGCDDIEGVHTTDGVLWAGPAGNKPLWLSLSAVHGLLHRGSQLVSQGADSGARTSGVALGGPPDLYAIHENGTPKYSAEYRRRLAALREALFDFVVNWKKVPGMVRGGTGYAGALSGPVVVSGAGQAAPLTVSIPASGVAAIAVGTPASVVAATDTTPSTMNRNAKHPRAQNIHAVAGEAVRRLPELCEIFRLWREALTRGKNSVYGRMQERWRSQKNTDACAEAQAVLEFCGIPPGEQLYKDFMKRVEKQQAGPPWTLAEFENEVDLAVQNLSARYREDGDAPSLLESVAVLFGDNKPGETSMTTHPHGEMVRTVVELVMRSEHPKMKWAACGPTLRSLMSMCGASPKALTTLYKVTGVGSTTKVDEDWKQRQRVRHLLHVLATMVAVRRVVLGMDNFVRKIKVNTKLSKHGSYCLSDNTTCIVTYLRETGHNATEPWPSDVDSIARRLHCNVSGCRMCLPRKDDGELNCPRCADGDDSCQCEATECLQCRAAARGTDANGKDYLQKGADRILELLTPRLVAPEVGRPADVSAPAARRIDPSAALLPVQTLIGSVAGLAQSLQTSTFKMLQVESAFVQNFDAARDGKTHDPRLQARGGSGIMDDTEVIAALLVSSNTTPGMMRAVQMARMHPVLGRLLDGHATPLLVDAKIYKCLQRLWWAAHIDRSLLAQWWPRGMYVALGIGLHVYKKLDERVSEVFAAPLRILFENMCGVKGDKKGRYFEKAKLSQRLVFYAPILVSMHEGGLAHLTAKLAENPENEALRALHLLLTQHLPLIFLHMAMVRLASSSDPADRKRAFDVIREQLLPEIILSMHALGSAEYTKLLLQYFSQLLWWEQHRPDIFDAFLRHPAAQTNEESIELVHAFIAIHNTIVRMAKADSDTTAQAFLDRGPLMMLKKVFDELAGLNSGGHTQGSADSQLREDVVYLRSALQQLIDRCAAAPGEECMNDKGHGVVWQHPVLGTITPEMTRLGEVGAVVEAARAGAAKDFGTDLHSEHVNSQIREWQAQWYDANEQRWRYRDASLLQLDHHFDGTWLEGNPEGAVAPVRRRRDCTTGSSATQWLPRQAAALTVNLPTLLDIRAWMEQMLALLPRRASFAATGRGITLGRSATDVAAEPDDYAQDRVDQGTASDDELDSDDEMGSIGAEDAVWEQVRDALVFYTREAGAPGGSESLLGPYKIKIASHADQTCEEILKAPPADSAMWARLAVCGTEARLEHLPHPDATADSCAMQLAKLVHVWVREQMSMRCDAAIQALEQGRHRSASEQARAAMAERGINGPAARDLQPSFSNTAWVLALEAMCSIQHTVLLINDGPLSDERRAIVQARLADASSHIKDALDQDGEKQTRISSSGARGGDAGSRLTDNLHQLDEAVSKIRSIVEQEQPVNRTLFAWE